MSEMCARAAQHAFLDAAKQFNWDKIKALVLANPAYVNVQPCGRWTAIHQAAYNGNQAAVEFLIEKVTL